MRVLMVVTASTTVGLLQSSVRLTKDKVSRVLLPLNHCTLEARKEARVEMKAKRHLEDIAPAAKKNPGEK